MRRDGGDLSSRRSGGLRAVSEYLDVVVADANHVFRLQRPILLVDDLAVDLGRTQRAVVLDEITIGTAVDGGVLFSHRPATHHDEIVVGLAYRAGIDLAVNAILLALWRFDFNAEHVACSLRRLC